MNYRLQTVKWILIAYLTALSMSLYAYARDEPSAEQVKAAFVFNFAKFVEWPSLALKSDDTLNLCVIGNDKTTKALQLLSQRQARGHLLQVVALTGQPASIKHHVCHLLFVGSDQKQRQQQWLAYARHMAILTIADNLDFIKEGGMISLYIEDNHVYFVVNQRTTQETGLKLSARMLQLARVPRE